MRVTEDAFRFDFELKRTHPFNLEAFSVFATSFLKFVECGRYQHLISLPPQFLDRRRIELAIYNHAKSAKALWFRKFVHQETAEDLEDRLSTASRYTRKRRVRSCFYCYARVALT